MATAEGPLARIAEIARERAQAWSSQSQVESKPAREGDQERGFSDSLEDVDSATEQVALQQELDVIRRLLQDKERLIDVTAAKCRRLEDELEDQHLACDGLKQDLERERISLIETRGQIARASQERQALEAHYQKRLSAEQQRPFSQRRERSSASRSGLGTGPSLMGFLAGLVAGVLLSAIAFFLWLQLDPPSVKDAGRPDRQDSAHTATSSEAQPQVAQADREEPGLVIGDEQPVPVVLGTVQDRLSDGSASPLMMRLQGGDFTMGKQRALPIDDEGPARSVRLGGFLIGATEVTFENFDRFVRATGHQPPSDYGWGRGKRPVVDVSWEDARAYAQWLSARTGRHYRLPSEAEWEYAAAAGQRSPFWWGYKPEHGRAVCFNCGTQWDNLSSAPVGSFGPNPLGLFDTAGNVMEWVEDCYHPNYVDAPANGEPWGGENCRFRVARGGAFNKPARSMRSTARHRFAAGTRMNALGFRLARDE